MIIIRDIKGGVTTLSRLGDIDLMEVEIHHFFVFHKIISSLDLLVEVPLPQVSTLATFVVIGIVITLANFMVTGTAEVAI